MTVTAKDKSTGNSQNIQITNDKGRLSADEIQRMVDDAEKFKEEDEIQRKRIESRNKLESYIYNLQNSIDLNSKLNKLPKKEILEQRELIKKWSLIEKRLEKISKFEISAPNSLKESILKIQSERNLNYTSIIRELSDKVKKSGRIWLSRISKKVRDVIIC